MGYRCFMICLILRICLVCVLKCVCLGCSFLNTHLSTHTLKPYYFGIIKYCHILHMYSIQDMLISSLETKPIMRMGQCGSKTFSTMSFVFSDVYTCICWSETELGFWGKWDSIQRTLYMWTHFRWHTYCAEFCHFLLDVVFHAVPSLQQNIHIKTLADDMVRCLV